MPSSYTASLRFTRQATGEGLNIWGDVLNGGVVTLIDFAQAGWVTKVLTGNYTLATANGMSDEARAAMLKFTGVGPFTVTIPAVSKRYDVWNGCFGVLTITNGSASVAIQPGEVVSIATDGGANLSRVQPTDFGGSRITSVGSPLNAGDVATKQYADNLAFTANAGILPGQAGNAGRFLTTDGAVASWAAPTVSQISDYASDQATKRATATGLAIAFAVAF